MRLSGALQDSEAKMLVGDEGIDGDEGSNGNVDGQWGEGEESTGDNTIGGMGWSYSTCAMAERRVLSKGWKGTRPLGRDEAMDGSGLERNVDGTMREARVGDGILGRRGKAGVSDVIRGERGRRGQWMENGRVAGDGGGSVEEKTGDAEGWLGRGDWVEEN